MLFAASRAQAADPVVGTWILPPNRQVDVQATSATTFQGILRRESSCPQSFGSVVWELNGSGGHFTGSVAYLDPNTCSVQKDNSATFDLVSNITLKVCSTDPRLGIRGCALYARLGPAPGGGDDSAACDQAADAVGKAKKAVKSAKAKVQHATHGGNRLKIGKAKRRLRTAQARLKRARAERQDACG
jgi:hypothetical protein